VRCARNDPASRLASQEGYGGNRAGGFLGAIVSPIRVRYVAAARAARGPSGGVGELGAACILRAKPETTSSVLLFNIATDDLGGV
jgi:hypothetical protein